MATMSDPVGPNFPGAPAATLDLLGVGTVFPTDPTAGQMYFRTDVRQGLWCFFDGTRWLSVEVYSFNASVSSITDTDSSQMHPLPSDYKVFLTTISGVMRVSGSSDWECKLQTITHDAATATIWTGFGTDGLTGGKWWRGSAPNADVEVDGTGINSGVNTIRWSFTEISGTEALSGAYTVDYHLLLT